MSGTRVGRLGVLPGDDLCSITAFCAVDADADRFRADCKKHNDRDDDTLGSYACVHITPVDADRVKLYRFIDEDTRCILQVRGGVRNLDNDIIQSCARAARDAIGPAQIGAIATTTVVSRTSSSPPDEHSAVPGFVAMGPMGPTRTEPPRIAPGHEDHVRADNIGRLIRQLADDDSEPVRLLAALSLVKLGDPRAILPLARALGNDTDKYVRRVAALGLGLLVIARPNARIRKLALSALTQASQSDNDDAVRGDADKALRSIGVASGRASPPQGGSAIYVNIGPMAANTGDAAVDARLKALMVKVANQTMTRVASYMATTLPGGAAPTSVMLQAASAVGFFIDGTVKELKVKDAGSSTTVACKINMLLASYPDKSVSALLDGGATVQASSSPNDLALAIDDCVSAVVEDLVKKKIVPEINGKAGR